MNVLFILNKWKTNYLTVKLDEITNEKKSVSLHNKKTVGFLAQRASHPN